MSYVPSGGAKVRAIVFKVRIANKEVNNIVPTLIVVRTTISFANQMF